MLKVNRGRNGCKNAQLEGKGQEARGFLAPEGRVVVTDSWRFDVKRRYEYQANRSFEPCAASNAALTATRIQHTYSRTRRKGGGPPSRYTPPSRSSSRLRRAELNALSERPTESEYRCTTVYTGDTCCVPPCSMYRRQACVIPLSFRMLTV